VTLPDFDSTQTSRVRLLTAGRTLFARNGYEQTSTAAIARASGSSESQLIRYFGGKAGLLEAIFNDAWTALNDAVAHQLDDAAHGREVILRLLGTMIQALSRDHDIAFLFLFEGRRMRGGSQEVQLSDGFQKFMQFVGKAIDRGQEDGSFRTDIAPQVLCSAMLGCAEGMIRDRIMSERANHPHTLDDEAILKTFTAMVNGLAPAGSA